MIISTIRDAKNNNAANGAIKKPYERYLDIFININSAVEYKIIKTATESHAEVEKSVWLIDMT